MIRRIALLLTCTAALAACQQEPSSRQNAAQDDRDIAQVKADQSALPPAIAVSPQLISIADIQANKLFGAGCAFLLPDNSADPIAVTNSNHAALKLGGKMVTFASDPGGTRMPLGTWAHYVGMALSLTLEKEPGDGVQSGEEAMHWNGAMTIHDADHRIVYRSAGVLECGA